MIGTQSDNKDLREELGRHVDDNWPLSIEFWPKNTGNCYSAAAGIPHAFAFNFLGYISNSNKASVKAAIDDINAIPGLEARLLENEDELVEGEYLLKFLYRDVDFPPFYDFHFMRKLDNDTWIHKNGRVCEPEIITNEAAEQFVRYYDRQYLIAMKKAR